MDRIKNIISAGLYQGWSYNNIISQIMYEIASDDEMELLYMWIEIPELLEKAKKLYREYIDMYYQTA